jgi:protein O-GlcNAc transferase
MMDPRPHTPTGAIRTAFELARQGQLQDAETLCLDVLRQQGDHAEALLLRAIIEVQTGRTAEGVVSIRRSLQKDATRAAARALLGDALLSLNQPREAIESYDAALFLDPGLTGAHFGRGNALLDLQRFREASESYEQFLRFKPNDAEALFNRGTALFHLKELQAALASFDAALAARASYAAALHNRGSVLMLLGQPAAALASFEAALAITPAFPQALYNRACALRALRSSQLALEAFERVLQVQPDLVEALVGRGEILRELKRPAHALTDFDRAMRVNAGCVAALRGRGDALLDLGSPVEALAAHDAALRYGTELASSHNSRGNSLRALKRNAEAIAAYDESLRLDPRNATVHYNRGTAWLQREGRAEEAVASFTRALELDPEFAYGAGSLFYTQQNRADWSVIAPVAGREHILRAVLAGKPVIAPFAFLSLSDSAAAQQRCAMTFAADRAASALPRLNTSRDRHDRIRVAYVSADLREHAVSYLLAGVFERHDRERFETIGISLRSGEASALGERVRKAFDRFIDVSDTADRDVAQLMRDLEVDIAVDLGGFTQGLRLQIFANRAAPIQVNYLGYPGTLGAPFMDYLIADSFVIPPEKQQHYCERIVYLPDCFQANDDRRLMSDRVFSRAEQGLPEDAFVFCCLNNSHKINRPIFDIWMRLLARVPNSVLWLLGHDAAVSANLRREAQSRGVDAARLVFTERAPYPEHLSRLKLADLFLDTLPFNAGATASDALWAGVPLLTCAGDAFAARMAGSLLHAVGLPELVSFSAEQYEAQAAELALDTPRLQALRQRLAESRTRSPLFDTDRFRRHFEAALTEMWRRHEAGQEPASFSVGTKIDHSPEQ